MLHMKHQSRRVVSRGMMEGQAHAGEEDLEYGTMAVLGHETGKLGRETVVDLGRGTGAKPDHETVVVLGHETGEKLDETVAGPGPWGSDKSRPWWTWSVKQ